MLFDFTNAWALILMKVDIVGIKFRHATIRVLFVHHIPFEMCRISYEHHLSSCRINFFHVYRLGYARSQLNLMGISDPKMAFYHAITHMGWQIHSCLAHG